MNRPEDAEGMGRGVKGRTEHRGWCVPGAVGNVASGQEAESQARS